jgi:hypothetical protein
MTGTGVTSFMLGLAVGSAQPKRRLKNAAWGALLALLAACILFMPLEQFSYGTLATSFTILNVSLMACSWGIVMARAREVRANARWTATALLLCAATIACWVPAAASGASVSQLNSGAWLLWPGALFALERGTSEAEIATAARAPARQRITPVLAVALLMCCASATHLWAWAYEDDRPVVLDAVYSHARLAGVRSTSARVHETETLLSLLATRVRPGDVLLVYGYPAVNYLSGTRPALKSSILGPPQLQSQWLAHMERKHRTPRYAVTPSDSTLRDLGINSPDPVLAYVRTHYHKVVESGPFVIWAIAR